MLGTETNVQIQSPGRRALRRFLRHKLAVGSTLFMLVVILGVFPFASVVAPISPVRTDLRAVRQAPSTEHLLGTDLIGRDVWSRLIYGGRVSIAVGLVAVAIFMSIGTILGSIAGYYGGTVDMVIMRITDTVMAFPVLVILISIVAIVGPGLLNAMVALVSLGGPVLRAWCAAKSFRCAPWTSSWRLRRLASPKDASSVVTFCPALSRRLPLPAVLALPGPF